MFASPCSGGSWGSWFRWAEVLAYDDSEEVLEPVERRASLA